MGYSEKSKALSYFFKSNYKAFRKSFNPNEEHNSENLTKLDALCKAHIEIIGVHSPFLTEAETGWLYRMNEDNYINLSMEIMEVSTWG